MCTAAAATAAALSRLLIPDHHPDYKSHRYDKDKCCYYGPHIIDKECHMFHLLFLVENGSQLSLFKLV